MKPKTIFDHANAICADKDPDYIKNLDPKSRSTYSTYMINRILSMNVHYIPIVDFIQKYTKLPVDIHYRFMSDMLPKKKVYNKYIKAKTKETDQWCVDLLANYFKVSVSVAKEYLDLFMATDDGKIELNTICSMHGIEQSQINSLVGE